MNPAPSQGLLETFRTLARDIADVPAVVRHMTPAEVIEARLKPGAELAYDEPTVARLEHHLCLLDGALRLTLHLGDEVGGAGPCPVPPLPGRRADPGPPRRPGG